jgi:DNA modification methylase
MKHILINPKNNSGNNSIIYNGDSLDILLQIPENSVHSIVTDAPYHLESIVKRFGRPNSTENKFGKDGAFQRVAKGFKGKDWDGGDIAFQPEIWKKCYRVLKPGGHVVAFSHSKNYHKMATAIEEARFEIRDQLMWIYGQGLPKSHDIGNGFGTALKPSHEPIVLARKPIKEKSIKENFNKWGTGGINISACRFGYETKLRFPSNVIVDEEIGTMLDEVKLGISKYFYCPKASKKDKGGNNIHPTVKPTELMQYLVKLVTPANGVCLDMFFGSGSTGKACIREGINFIGIEKDIEYYNLAIERCLAEIDIINAANSNNILHISRDSDLDTTLQLAA